MTVMDKQIEILFCSSFTLVFNKTNRVIAKSEISKIKILELERAWALILTNDIHRLLYQSITYNVYQQSLHRTTARAGS